MLVSKRACRRNRGWVSVVATKDARTPQTAASAKQHPAARVTLPNDSVTLLPVNETLLPDHSFGTRSLLISSPSSGSHTESQIPGLYWAPLKGPYMADYYIKFKSPRSRPTRAIRDDPTMNLSPGPSRLVLLLPDGSQPAQKNSPNIPHSSAEAARLWFGRPCDAMR